MKKLFEMYTKFVKDIGGVSIINFVTKINTKFRPYIKDMLVYYKILFTVKKSF